MDRFGMNHINNERKGLEKKMNDLMRWKNLRKSNQFSTFKISNWLEDSKSMLNFDLSN